MSKLQLPNGDDHPEAAHKHLDDAQGLLSSNRSDGAAYLAGYVVECSIKALILYDTAVPLPASRLPWKKGTAGHNLNELAVQASSLAAIAGAKSARYLGPAVQGLAKAGIASWRSEMRYRAPYMTQADAQSWFADAQAIYQESVGEMLKDGIL